MPDNLFWVGGGGCWSNFRGDFLNEFLVFDISMQINDQTFHTYKTCFQNESIYIQKTHILCDACIVIAKLQNAFSPLYFFLS